MTEVNVLVTGAQGFIGSSLIKSLSNGQYAVAGASHSLTDSAQLQLRAGESVAELAHKLKGYTAIIHTAGLAHIAKPDARQVKEFYHVNVGFTEKLAIAAGAAGVTHFIFLSSIGVNGNGVSRHYTEHDEPAPVSAYAESKMMAEQTLWQAARESALKVTVLRLPLVYGLGCKGNMRSLLRFVNSGFPVPLARVRNKRSLLGIDNLADILMRTINNPRAYNEMFLAGDGEELSTSEIMACLSEGIGGRFKSIPIPVPLLKLSMFILGQSDKFDKLTGNLTVDISKLSQRLQWQPKVNTQDGLKEFARSSLTASEKC
ncbi:NAD-dependent epimerase/dehydratase family protein [Gilvimarinus sp. SDUM040013]|uniref:NAD-dependent epimerase/dehydratase family protein n=1 Tax=Gilvimarinus gilvus TaxID=3058038 RepID=A0ABU4RU32_9GAMM|nr:NAD-dependent epimerase/dehydratase family protein [Gilvimarinus sp. SDUM040013]MDO3385011.1 NAD-dependent epimerase/dehydratase family protein [Gilvimarinus sp. SDUM040013]MDX6848386.1 NAD-dependent epimerase/dehydratase family protein [Gilvimarinus sp. SDUM040013]